MQLENIGADIHVRHTDTDGKSYVQHHRVWDKETFLATHAAAARRANDEARNKGKPALAKIEQVLSNA